MAITGKQRHFLRGLGHHLNALVQIGKEGVTESLTDAVNEVLEQHELIKVRFLESAGDRHELAAEIAKAARAELAGLVGRIAILYRARKKDPDIILPRGAEDLRGAARGGRASERTKKKAAGKPKPGKNASAAAKSNADAKWGAGSKSRVVKPAKQTPKR